VVQERRDGVKRGRSGLLERCEYLGDQLPTVTSLAKRYSVAVGTAHRAIALLSEAGEITVSRGRRAVIT